MRGNSSKPTSRDDRFLFRLEFLVILDHSFCWSHWRSVSCLLLVILIINACYLATNHMTSPYLFSSKLYIKWFFLPISHLFDSKYLSWNKSFKIKCHDKLKFTKIIYLGVSWPKFMSKSLHNFHSSPPITNLELQRNLLLKIYSHSRFRRLEFFPHL